MIQNPALKTARVIVQYSDDGQRQFSFKVQERTQSAAEGAKHYMDVREDRICYEGDKFSLFSRPGLVGHRYHVYLFRTEDTDNERTKFGPFTRANFPTKDWTQMLHQQDQLGEISANAQNTVVATVPKDGIPQFSYSSRSRQYATGHEKLKEGDVRRVTKVVQKSKRGSIVRILLPSGNEFVDLKCSDVRFPAGVENAEAQGYAYIPGVSFECSWDEGDENRFFVQIAGSRAGSSGKLNWKYYLIKADSQVCYPVPFPHV